MLKPWASVPLGGLLRFRFSQAGRPGVQELGSMAHAREPGVGVPAAVLARHPLEDAPEPPLCGFCLGFGA